MIQDYLTDIKEEWSEKEGKGFCHCKNCKNESVPNYGCNQKERRSYDKDDTNKTDCDQCPTCRSVSICSMYKYRCTLKKI